MKWNAALLIFQIFVLLHPLNANKCNFCEKPPASSISFCSLPSFDVCRQDLSWIDMDYEAETNYLKRLETLNLDSLSSPCEQSIARMECAMVFKPCEINKPLMICSSVCNELNCSQSIQTDICESTKEVSKTKNCYTLEYSGPKKSAWILGFIISIVFSFLASVGINLQKKALKTNEETARCNSVAPLPAYRLPLWCLGFFLIIAGSILDFVAFGLAPQSLLAPLAALTLVWNMLLAPCFNKERLGKKDIIATFVIIGGATITVVFASHSTPEYSLDDLKLLYHDPLTVSYFVIVFIFVLVHFLVLYGIEYLHLTSRRHRVIQLGKPAFWSRVHLVGYAGLAGTVGGQSVLFAKSTAELCKAVFRGEDALKHFEMYLFLLALITCLGIQIHFLNGGLTHYDALSVVPIYQAYWIVTGVMGGIIYFQEIHSFSIQQAVMFVGGIMVTIAGVALLSQRASTPVIVRKDTIVESNIPPAIPEESNEENEDEPMLEQVKIQVFHNFLDMSPRIGVRELLGGRGMGRVGQLGRWRGRRFRDRGESTSMGGLDDFANERMGKHSNLKDNTSLQNPTHTNEEWANATTNSSTDKDKKKRSITFGGFTNVTHQPI